MVQTTRPIRSYEGALESSRRAWKHAAFRFVCDDDYGLENRRSIQGSFRCVSIFVPKPLDRPAGLPGMFYMYTIATPTSASNMLLVMGIDTE